MKDILNLYNYKVCYEKINRKDVKLIFSVSLPDWFNNKYTIDIMNLCVALNTEFNISKIDIDSYDYNDTKMFIIANKDIGYKILKTFLDNTSDLEEIEKINKEFARVNEDLYGKSYFSKYIEEYKTSLFQYEEYMKEHVKLDLFNLYTKEVTYYQTDNCEIYIRIAQKVCSPINILDEDYNFNLTEICLELKKRFNINYTMIYTMITYPDDCFDGPITGIDVRIPDVNTGFKLLKAFLDNTDLSLLEDKSLVENKKIAEIFKSEYYDKFKNTMQSYITEFNMYGTTL